MTLTWKQVMAYLEFNDALDRIDRVYDLAITATGSQGDQKAIDKLIKDIRP
jgi:aminoglycoside phosphotransferase family enzyme